MRNFLIISVFICLLYSCTDKKSKPIINEIYNWSVEYDNDKLNASVPGCIHTDLINNNIINDPFFRTNEDSVQWVSDSVWRYTAYFNWKNTDNIKNNSIVFEGLDTYAKIYINDQRISNISEYDAYNAFRRWEYKLPQNLKAADNKLVVEFYPSTYVDSIEASKLPYKLPDNRVFTRKPPYQSGWDWGPKLNTVGIIKPVYILSWKELIIRDFHIIQQSLSDQEAVLIVETEIEADMNQQVNLTYYLNGNKYTSEKTNLSKGINIIKQKINIQDPIKWYPNGKGDPYLYEVKLKAESFAAEDNAYANIGLRTIKLVTDKDEKGSKFTFYVNGQPLFIKGANYVPSDSFIPSRKKEQYTQLLEDCVKANMNMIRVWGGGFYEDDKFYAKCDELGLLVWQDFMFACALYPGDPAFLDNVRVEAEQQVKRLRNHPCIALWCGNNEVKNGWEDWGWQEAYDIQTRAGINKNIVKLFDELLPSTIEKYNKGQNYISTSPLWGWGHSECCTEGSSHYWGVWWGKEPFEVWKAKTGRFMAEYGFQSYPSVHTINKFTVQEDRYITSEVIKKHQKHPEGLEIISMYMDRYLGLPKNINDNIDDFIYLSQILQAYGIGDAIETHRRHKPYCMGTLYWQLNDCWPCASWSSIDYYGNKKALFYKVKDKYEDIILSVDRLNDSLKLYLISDTDSLVEGVLNIKVLDFNGNELRKDMVNDVIAYPDSVTQVVIYPLRNDFIDKADSIFIKLDYSYDNNTIEYFYFLSYPKDMALPNANVVFNVEKYKNNYIITLSSNTFAKNVYISSDVEGYCDDNYFELMPNEKKKVIFYPRYKDNEKASFKIKTYNNVI